MGSMLSGTWESLTSVGITANCTRLGINASQVCFEIGCFVYI